MLAQDVAERIRTIFLHEQPYVTIAEATRMLRWSRSEMNRAIRDGEVELTTTCSGERFDIRELAEMAFDLWTLPVIEEALGREASLILPPAVRTRKLVVRLPAYQVAALRTLAGDASESVDTMLERMFLELADIHRERLAPVISGLAEAIAWPREPSMPQAQ
ncbi:MAG TPA: hypothetical protein VE974_23210 [Thermoanaerobaculia bacterium]|nr:hypothetical protein [Thermoanaerobaculia bacterium]